MFKKKTFVHQKNTEYLKSLNRSHKSYPIIILALIFLGAALFAGWITFDTYVISSIITIASGLIFDVIRKIYIIVFIDSYAESYVNENTSDSKTEG